MTDSEEKTEEKPKLPTRASSELLSVKGGKEAAVFSLLKSKDQKKGTFKIGPCSALEQVKRFLPKLQQANDELAREIEAEPEKKSAYDIENVAGGSGPLIEMDLALYEDTDSESDLSETNSDELDILGGPIREENMIIPGSKAKCNLVEEL